MNQIPAENKKAKLIYNCKFNADKLIQKNIYSFFCVAGLPSFFCSKNFKKSVSLSGVLIILPKVQNQV